MTHNICNSSGDVEEFYEDDDDDKYVEDTDVLTEDYVRRTCKHEGTIGRLGRLSCDCCEKDLGECPHDEVTTFNEYVTCPKCGLKVIRRDLKTYPTGAVREATDKPHYHCIPIEPLRRVAQRYQLGSLKYSDYNWKKGMPYSDTYDHLMEHLSLWREGNTSEDHLAAAVFNIMCLMWYEVHMPELNNMQP